MRGNVCVCVCVCKDMDVCLRMHVHLHVFFLRECVSIRRVGQNRISAPYMTVCMVIFLLKYRMYTVYTYKCMVLANPKHTCVYVCACACMCVRVCVCECACLTPYTESNN